MTNAQALSPVDAMPRSCFLPSPFTIGCLMLPRLREVMRDEEIRSAHNEEQPALDCMRNISCKGCNIVICPLNSRYDPLRGDELSLLKEGRLDERTAKGEELLSLLVPEEARTRLAERGLTVKSWQITSRKKPCLLVYFKRGTETCSQIACDVGPMTIQHDSETIPLTSFEQLKELVSQSIDALTQPP